jgi:uncharacterized protein YdaU (DUF1376 family)
MGAIPFAQFYWGDFFADTMQLDGHESGTYLMLLGAAWVSPGCKLPDDDRKLARCARLTPEQWAVVRNAVMQYWHLEDGFWTQKRLLIERANVEARIEKSRANGRKGGRPKSLNGGPDKPTGFNQVTPEQTQPLNKSEPEPESYRKNQSSSEPKPPAHAHTQEGTTTTNLISYPELAAARFRGRQLKRVLRGAARAADPDAYVAKCQPDPEPPPRPPAGEAITEPMVFIAKHSRAWLDLSAGRTKPFPTTTHKGETGRWFPISALPQEKRA